MLKNILKIIDRDGYISRTQLARELGISKEMVDEGMNQIMRMGYLQEEKTGIDCSTTCAGCPFAKSCSKEIVRGFKISERGMYYLGR
ncbi:MAG: winged helix-turn-helix transcriptional regulator [Clostridium sp.]|nr:winged helix-turn-helix transcriptional regulator [Clostridium sp.]